MKTKFNIGKIEIQGVVVENISIEAEYSLSEMTGAVNFGKNLMQELIEDAPQMFESLERAFNKFNEIDNRVEKKQKIRISEEFYDAFNSNIEYIKKSAQERNAAKVIDIATETRSMCQKAVSRKHISQASFESCMLGIKELLVSIGIHMM